MQSWTFYETIPLQCKLWNPKLRYFNMIILDVFSGFSSVESELCIEEKFWYKAGPCFNFAFDSSIKPKRAAILFYKKVVPLNFGFDSLGNEQNFLSNQKAGKLMNVTRNKLFLSELYCCNYDNFCKAKKKKYVCFRLPDLP